MLIASLALARFHPFGNAHYEAAASAKPLLPQAPPEVRTLLINKCADCHSDQPVAPFYAHLAPVSWLLERHIVNGRKVLNLSQWDTYSVDRQQVLASKILQQSRSRQMPMLQYRIIHRGTAISDSDVRTLTQWSRQLQAAAEPPPVQPPPAAVAAPAPPVRVEVAAPRAIETPAKAAPVTRTVVATAVQPPAVAAIKAGPDHGETVYQNKCADCHSMTKDRDGPRLQGLFGRAAAAGTTFDFSPALKNSHIVWTAATLDPWLADPVAVVPDTTMDTRVVNAQDRADIIEYLKQVTR